MGGKGGGGWADPFLSKPRKQHVQALLVVATDLPIKRAAQGTLLIAEDARKGCCRRIRNYSERIYSEPIQRQKCRSKTVRGFSLRLVRGEATRGKRFHRARHPLRGSYEVRSSNEDIGHRAKLSVLGNPMS